MLLNKYWSIAIVIAILASIFLPGGCGLAEYQPNNPPIPFTPPKNAVQIEQDTTPQNPYSINASWRRSSPPSGYLFGVVNDEGAHYDDLFVRGVRAITFELQWKLYEPQEGVYNQSYIDHLKNILIQLKSQGWYVQLIPGFHYAPDWVYTNYPNMAYVNQYGEAYLPDPVALGEYRVINGPFNPQARQLIAGYLARIFQDFPQSDPTLQFDSVRVGGGVQGELRYPPPLWNGHQNSFWAFDVYAQDQSITGIPSNAQNWRPGIDPNPGSVGRGQLIVNPGFEHKHSYFPIPAWSPDDEVTAELIGTGQQAGLHSLKLTTSTANRIHQYVRVQPNTSYTIGGWLRSADGFGRARIFVNQYNQNFALTGNPFVKIESKSTNWTQLSATFTTGSSTRYVKIEMDGDRPGSYYFDDLSLTVTGDTNTSNRDINIPLAFYDWYVQMLTEYQDWQINELRKYFPGQLDVVYAGKGLQQRQITDSLTNDLSGDGWSENTSALYEATDYPRHLPPLVQHQNIAVYLTGIEDPPASLVDDSSPYPSDWSAARWMAHLAGPYNLPVWGENSGRDTYQDMQIAIDRMRANRFLGILWVVESELYASPNSNGYATASQYEALIASLTSTHHIYVPGIVRMR